MSNGQHRRALTTTSRRSDRSSGTGNSGAPYLAARTYHALDCPDARPIPSAGLRAGEIVGYRCWKIRDGRLASTIMHFIWHPNENVRALNGDPGYGDFIHGYYAFNTIELVKEEFDDEFARHYGVAYGTVNMWGEVIEHERGWRAEYAAVRSIDEVVLPFDGDQILKELRELYGV